MYFAAQREIIETWCVLMSLPRGIPTAVNDFEHAHKNVQPSPTCVPGDIVATLFAYSFVDGFAQDLAF